MRPFGSSGAAGTFEVNRNDWTESQFNTIVAIVGMTYKSSMDFDSIGGGGGNPFIPRGGVLPPLPKVRTPEEWRAYYEKLWSSGERKSQIETLRMMTHKKVTISTSRGEVKAYEVDTIWGKRYYHTNVPVEYLPYSWNSVVSSKMTEFLDILYGENASEATISTYFGQYYQSSSSGLHEGLDVAVGGGTPFYSLADGVVLKAGGGTINAISIYNEELDVTYTYMHAQNISVERGDVISKGDLLAEEGKIGTSSYHVHVEINKGKYSGGYASLSDHILEAVSPYEYIK